MKVYISGPIGPVEWAAWIGVESGNVYVQRAAYTLGEYDFTFEAFCDLVKNGWPVAKVAPVARGFDFGDDVDT